MMLASEVEGAGWSFDGPVVFEALHQISFGWRARRTASPTSTGP